MMHWYRECGSEVWPGQHFRSGLHIMQDQETVQIGGKFCAKRGLC